MSRRISCGCCVQQDAETFKTLAAQAGTDAAALTRGATELILIVEEGFVPQRHSMKVPLPVGTAVVSVDFPFYQDPAHTPMAVEVMANGQSCGLSAPRAVGPVAGVPRSQGEDARRRGAQCHTRGGARGRAGGGAPCRNDGVQGRGLSGDGGGLGDQQADTRAWYTLRRCRTFYRGAFQPGEHTIEMRNQVNGFVTRFPVKVAEAKPVWCGWRIWAAMPASRRLR
jgi:hypothetical protein